MATSVFTFARFHFGDRASVQNHAADQLYIEMTHVQHAPAGLADSGESGDQKVVEFRAARQLFPEIDGAGRQIDVGKLLEGGLEIVDSGDNRTHRLDFALVFGAEDFGKCRVDHIEVFNPILAWIRQCVDSTAAGV